MATVHIYRDFNTDRKYIGRLEHGAQGLATFQYDESYCRHARANGELGISERLPVVQEPYPPRDTESFFRGLLPEGEVYGNLSMLYQNANQPQSALHSLISKTCETMASLNLKNVQIKAMC